jgi:hypothetical protein
VPDHLAAWTADLAAALDLPDDPATVERGLVLDVARDAAHGVARPAAPLTTFLVGYAAGLRGGGTDAVRAAAAIATQLAAARADEHAGESDAG